MSSRARIVASLATRQICRRIESCWNVLLTNPITTRRFCSPKDPARRSAVHIRQARAGDDGKIVAGGFRAQGEQAFANLRALEAGGSSLRDVIKDHLRHGHEQLSAGRRATIPRTPSPKSKLFTTPWR